MRPLATLLACLALAGLAVAAEGGAARSPAAGSYIVVFKSNAAQGPTVATDRAADRRRPTAPASASSTATR